MSYADKGRSDINLDLPLPDFERLEIGGKEFVKTDFRGFQGVLRIYATYRTLSELHLELNDEVENIELHLSSLETSLERCNTTLRAAEDDRQFVYQLRESDQKRAGGEARKAKLRAILIGGGATLVGVGVGIIIGALVIGR
jgi:hypothetical protein